MLKLGCEGGGGVDGYWCIAAQHPHVSKQKAVCEEGLHMLPEWICTNFLWLIGGQKFNGSSSWLSRGKVGGKGLRKHTVRATVKIS